MQQTTTSRDTLSLRVERQSRALRTLNGCIHALSRAATVQHFLNDICRILFENGGVSLAWVGRCSGDDEILPLARAGRDDGYVDTIRTTRRDDPRGQGPVGTAMRTGKVQIARSVETDGGFSAWRSQALARGFGSVIALPLLLEGLSPVVLAIYAMEPDAFDDEEVTLLQELAQDVAYGIRVIEDRAARRTEQVRLAHLHAVLRATREVNQLITRERDPQRLLDKACKALVSSRSFEFAMAVLIERSTPVFFTSAGVIEEFDALCDSLNEGKLSPCLERAARSQKIDLARGEPQPCPGCPRPGGCPAIGDVVISPLCSGGQTFGAMYLVIPKGRFDDLEERELIREIVADVSYALQAIDTERKHEAAVKSAKQTEQKFQLLFEAMTESVALCELVRNDLGVAVDYRLVDVNPAFARHTGIATDTARGMLASTMQNSPTALLLDRFAAVVETQTPCRFDLWYAPSEKHFEITAFPSGVDQFASVFADVTDRKRYELALRTSAERWSATFDALSDAVFVLSSDQVLLEVNASGCKLLARPRDRIVGRSAFEVFPIPAQAALSTSRESSFGKDILAMAHYEHKGSTHEVTAWPIVDASGKVTAYVQVVRDITRQVAEDRSRANLEKQVLVSQRLESIGKLAGGIAHDFNNLLSVIINYGNFALAALHAQDPMREDISEIVAAGERAAALTSQLLAFSRQQILRPEIVDLNHIVHGMQGMLRRLIGEDINLVSNLHSDLGYVKADPSQMEQIVMNIVVNARDAMPKGGRITIDTRNETIAESPEAHYRSLTPGRHVLMQFTDTGTGMDEQTKLRVFEPFFTTKDAGKGTGLGLSTVYGIVKQSGGSIWIDSEPGAGTTFKVYFPLADETDTTDTLPPKSRAAARGAETVLLVEDDDRLRRVARRILEGSGYKVLAASRGDEALRVSDEHTGELDLVLTDVVMPGMSGREFVRKLVETRPGVRVLYMSGYTDESIARHGVLEPGTHFIAKPFTAPSLAKKVREVLDGKVG